MTKIRIIESKIYNIQMTFLPFSDALQLMQKM